MIYHLEYGNQVKKDIKKHQNSGNILLLEKLDLLLSELRIHPLTGTGKPEQLKHFSIPTFSRRISDKHRLVYEIDEFALVVVILSVWGHYADK